MKSDAVFFNKKRTIHAHGKIMDLRTPKVMAIINVTPDSFYDGNKYMVEDAIRERAELCIAEGADILDVGAYSSRPGAQHISDDEEKARLKVALKTIREVSTEVWVSLDTFRADIAQWSVDNYAVDVINDISSGDMDDRMVDAVAELKVPYIMMHMQGTPQNMQANPSYDDAVQDLIQFFSQKLAHVKSKGVEDVIVDPGFGFGKTLDHNYEIFKGLKDFEMLGSPLMVGVSRKSMIQKYLGVSADEALNATTALHAMALQNGADILRAHDVKQAKEVVKLYEKLNLVADNS